MAYVYVAPTDDDRFAVRVLSGLRGDRTWHFDTHAEAVAFALKKMGSRYGFIVDHTTAEEPER